MFWAGERTQTPCCRFATDEDLDEDPEVFECETCPVASQLEGLDSDNRRAWELAHLLGTRLLNDTHAAGVALERLTTDLDEVEFADLLRRMNLIYDVLAPPPKQS